MKKLMLVFTREQLDEFCKNMGSFNVITTDKVDPYINNPKVFKMNKSSNTKEYFLILREPRNKTIPGQVESNARFDSMLKSTAHPKTFGSISVANFPLPQFKVTPLLRSPTLAIKPQRIRNPKTGKVHFISYK